ncbi:MAG: VCBS repeat-containing protein [Pyrinomonadaceae bacterium]
MKNKYLQKLLIFFSLVFISILSTAELHAQNMFHKVNDFDGDGKADYVVTRNENGLKVWYVYQSTNGFKVFQWGLDTDKEAAGDYDGDGKSDFAVSRRHPPVMDANNVTLTGGSLYIYRSSTNTYYFTYERIIGIADTVTPLPQDFNGDGKTEESLIFNKTDGSKQLIIHESLANNRRTYTANSNQSFLGLGDLIGNVGSDVIYLVLNSYTLNITDYTAGPPVNVQFGIQGDQFVAGDFDGDGKGDIAVFRGSTGTWWVKRSSDNVLQASQWGNAGDIPVPADYDGDGKTDFAIWRSGTYWIFGSQNGVSVFNWGSGSDTPVHY